MHRLTSRRQEAVKTLAKIRGGNSKNGWVVFERTCSSCHVVNGKGKEFGPALDGLAGKYSREHIIKHVLWPNEEIAKGYETVQVLTLDGEVLNGFVLEETAERLSLGVATDDGKGKRVDIDKEEIDEQKAMKASSMPEGLVQTIAPSEFLDLVQFLGTLYKDSDNWISTGGNKKNLKKHGSFKEISRDGKIRIREDFPAHWNEDVHLTLNPNGANRRDFAFHSPEPAIENPYVTIQLVKPSEIRHIAIQNRRSSQFHNRADGLTVWISDDAENWKQVWTAKKVAANYDVELPAGTKGQYVKVGLNKSGIFHLNQIMVFGEQ